MFVTHPANTRHAMLLRVARAAVRDHAIRDPLAYYGDEEFDPDGRWMPPLWGSTRTEMAVDRLLHMSEMRDSKRSRGTAAFLWGEQERRTVEETLSDATVLGLASDFDPRYSRHAAEIVIRVRYAEPWMADYAVGPQLPPSCWQD